MTFVLFDALLTCLNLTKYFSLQVFKKHDPTKLRELTESGSYTNILLLKTSREPKKDEKNGEKKIARQQAHLVRFPDLATSGGGGQAETLHSGSQTRGGGQAQHLHGGSQTRV